MPAPTAVTLSAEDRREILDAVGEVAPSDGLHAPVCPLHLPSEGCDCVDCAQTHRRTDDLLQATERLVHDWRSERARAAERDGAGPEDLPALREFGEAVKRMQDALATLHHEFRRVLQVSDLDARLPRLWRLCNNLLVAYEPQPRRSGVQPDALRHHFAKQLAFLLFDHGLSLSTYEAGPFARVLRVVLKAATDNGERLPEKPSAFLKQVLDSSIRSDEPRWS